MIDLNIKCLCKSMFAFQIEPIKQETKEKKSRNIKGKIIKMFIRYFNISLGTFEQIQF